MGMGSQAFVSGRSRKNQSRDGAGSDWMQCLSVAAAGRRAWLRAAIKGLRRQKPRGFESLPARSRARPCVCGLSLLSCKVGVGRRFPPGEARRVQPKSGLGK